MTQLAFQPGDKTWTALRERAKRDLYWLVETILGYRDKVPMRLHAHELMCRVATGTTGVEAVDNTLALKLLLPRGWGKTCGVTTGLTIQWLLQDPETSVLICNEREQNAKDFLKEIKWHFESNELLRALFPELIPPSDQDTEWSGTRITINRKSGRKEPSVFVIGVGGTVTGMHPDRIIVDDMISREAAENARRGSWQIMEEVNRWTHTLEALASTRPLRGHRIVFIGTRWFFNDCYDHVDTYFGHGEAPKEWLLSVPVENGHKQTLPVQVIGDMAVFIRRAREEGRASWPEKWDDDKLAQMQADDAILYSANYENNPSSDATATFRQEWLKTYQWLDDHTVAYVNQAGLRQVVMLPQLDIVLIVDPGGFGKGIEDRARAALLVIGHTPTGEYLILDAWSERDTYVVAQQQAVAKARRYRVRKAGIEVEGQQIVFFDQLKRLLQESGLQVAVEALKTEGRNKDDRILQLESYFQRGLIYVGTGASFAEFRTQYQQFPRTTRRDVLDALAYLPKMIKPRTSGAPGMAGAFGLTLAQQKQQELAAYWQRRGRSPNGQILGR